MKLDPGKFICSRCGEMHRIESYVEFPLPENISRISSGAVQGELKVLSKFSYLVKEGLYVKSNLAIDVREYHTDLEIWNWVFIRRDVFNEAFNKYRAEKASEIVAVGQMVYPIPFYNLVDRPIVKIALTNENEYPKVKLAISNTALYQDWKYGITKEKLVGFMEYLYHL